MTPTCDLSTENLFAGKLRFAAQFAVEQIFRPRSQGIHAQCPSFRRGKGDRQPKAKQAAHYEATAESAGDTSR